MAFLWLYLHHHPSKATVDPGQVVQRLQAAFPGTVVFPGDRLAENVQRTDECSKRLVAEGKISPEGAELLTKSIQRQSQQYGPRFDFELPVQGQGPIRGYVHRYIINFDFDEEPPTVLWERLVGFLKSFGIGRVETSTTDARQLEVLADPPDSTNGVAGTLPAPSKDSMVVRGKDIR